jgi:AcrR family transcriptional regulator
MSKKKAIQGRPRDEESKQAILKATLLLLIKRGYSDLSIESIAAKAKVGKTTIYRWWPEKSSLVLEAFFDSTVEELKFSNTQSGIKDFESQIHSLANLLRSDRGEHLAALMMGAKTDAKLAAAIQEKWVFPRRKWGFERMQKSIEDGECHPDLDIKAALESLYSPLYARLLVGLSPLSKEEVSAYLKIIFPGIFRKF